MNIGIAGSGLAGRVCALLFIEAGFDVSLFDRGDISGSASAGWAAAGMLAPYAELEFSESLIFQMGLQALDLWPKIFKLLALDNALRLDGSIVVAHDSDWADLQGCYQRIASKLIEDDNIQLISKQDIVKLEPELDHWQTAYYLPQEGAIDNRAFYQAATAFLQKHTIAWHSNCNVQQLVPGSIHTDDQQYQFDWVIDCRGLGSGQYFNGIRGVRGEIIRVHAPDVNIARPIRFKHPRYPIYIVPQAGNHYTIGATQIESEDYSPISVRSSLELLTAAYSVHRGFAEARIIETSVNCRPALADNLPKLIEQPGLIAINGLFRHGYLLAPVMAKQALSILQQSRVIGVS